MQDITTSDSAKSTKLFCDEKHQPTLICKNCGFIACELCSKSHSAELKHEEFQQIPEFVEILSKQLAQKRNDNVQLRQKLENCTSSVNHELLLSQNISGAGYTAAVRAVNTIQSQLDLQKTSLFELQSALMNTLQNLDNYSKVLNKINELFEQDLKLLFEEKEPSKISSLIIKYKQDLVQYDEQRTLIESTIQQAADLLTRIHNVNYDSMASFIQLFSMAPNSVLPTTKAEELKKQIYAKAEEVKTQLDGWKTSVITLKESVDKGISGAIQTQSEITKRLVTLEQKLDEIRKGAFKEKFCSLCGKEAECIHRLDCKHKICRECVTTKLIDQLAREHKIEVVCQKCNKTCTQVNVELSCGCIEDLAPKRKDIIETTHGDVFVYNSITLQCARPKCRNQHEMKDEDCLLFFDKTFLDASMGSIMEMKEKDEMTSLRKEMEKLINEGKVDLSGKLIGNNEARYVADFVKINNKLKILDLTTNELGDEGIIIIAEALRENNSILKLDLRGNKFGESGKKYMEEVNESKGGQMRILYFYITMYLVKGGKNGK